MHSVSLDTPIPLDKFEALLGKKVKPMGKKNANRGWRFYGLLPV